MTYEDCEKAGISKFIARPDEKVVPLNELSLEDRDIFSHKVLDQICEEFIQEDFKRFGTLHGKNILINKEEES